MGRIFAFGLRVSEMNKIKYFLIIFAAPLILIACQPISYETLSAGPSSLLQSFRTADANVKTENKKQVNKESLSLILDRENTSASLGESFSKAIGKAVDSDPTIISEIRALEAKRHSIEAFRTNKNFQVSTSIYGGIEDVTDETAGIAVIVSANRLLYDGGRLDAQLSAEELLGESANQRLQASKERRAAELATFWVDLERYQDLEKLMSARLAVLSPLFGQLETVADAGIGDVSKVAAAQRVMSRIRVTQTDIMKELEQAKLSFENSFGALPVEMRYDQDLIANSVPIEITEEMIRSAPALRAEYLSYKSALLQIEAASLKDDINVGFESRLQRPLGSSSRDSDESIGLVLKKTIYNGNRISAELSQAKALADSAYEKLRYTFREGKRNVRLARRTISSMDEAIALAKAESEIAVDEIAYLRRQLIIGESTLDNVLSAEARLYEAQAQEINFLASKRKAELTILAAIGKLGLVIGLSSQ